ncbi:hypothetical protein OIU84_028160, partial [Salix udensis]
MMTIIDLARNIREQHNKPLKSPLGKRLGKSMGVVAKEVKSNVSDEMILEFEKAGEVTNAPTLSETVLIL